NLWPSNRIFGRPSARCPRPADSTATMALTTGRERWIFCLVLNSSNVSLINSSLSTFSWVLSLICTNSVSAGAREKAQMKRLLMGLLQERGEVYHGSAHILLLP